MIKLLQKRIAVIFFVIFIVFIPMQVLGADNGDVTVYVTNTGTKYHRENCSYLESKIAISLQEAVSKGYTACSRCNPPQLGEASANDTDAYTAPQTTKSSVGDSVSNNNKSDNNTTTTTKATNETTTSSSGGWTIWVGAGAICILVAAIIIIVTKRIRKSAVIMELK